MVDFWCKFIYKTYIKDGKNRSGDKKNVACNNI